MSKLINFSKDFEVLEGTENIDSSTNLVKWGKGNLYPQYLNYLYYSCAVHQGIVNGKVSFITGGGLEESTALESTIDMFAPLVREMCLSNEISDSYYLELRLDYTNKEKVEKVSMIPYEWVRVTELGTYQVSEDWSESTPEYRELRSYENKQDDDQSVIFAFKTKPMQFMLGGQGRKISKNYYPEPSYKSAIKSILTDIEAVNYQLSSFVNSFSVGTIISLNNGNIQNPNDKRKIEEELRDTTTGSDNASGVFITYANGEGTAPTVIQLSGDQLHERYTTMSQDVRDNIMKAHGVVSPTLFGFQTGGSFNQSEMDVAYILMKDNYFLQRQKQLLESINFIDEINGGQGKAEFKDVNPLAELKQQYTFKVDNKEEKKGLSDEETFKIFSQFGDEINDKNLLFSEALNLDEPFKSVFSKKEFSSFDIQVLNLIEDGNSFDKIYKSLGIKPLDLSRIYKRLIDSNKLTSKGAVTKQGKLDIVRSDASKYEIRYTYDVKPPHTEKIIEGTRGFCRNVIRAGRMYTYDDIIKMSSALGFAPEQLWRYRGGWYHNPNTGKNEPSCRHEWKQSLVYIK